MVAIIIVTAIQHIIAPKLLKNVRITGILMANTICVFGDVSFLKTKKYIIPMNINNTTNAHTPCTGIAGAVAIASLFEYTTVLEPNLIGTIGARVGCFVGDTDGNFVGFCVGDSEGGLVSPGIVGAHVVGFAVGSIVVGLRDGIFDGDSVGIRGISTGAMVSI